VLAGAPDYFKRRRKPSTPADLKEHNCIIETYLSRPSEWRLSKNQTITVSRGPLTSNSVRMTREAVLAGMGIAFLPKIFLAEDLAAKRLVQVLPTYVTERLPLYIMFPRGHYVLAKVKAFVDFMTTAIDEKTDVPSDAPQSSRRAQAAAV